ncbi:MAG: hypothetical protein AABZ53_05385 [Planctomycetota bacterium]
MSTVSVSVRPSLSVTVSVTVWGPTGKRMEGLTPVATWTAPSVQT